MTFFQSTQSSSARIMGTAVMMPWPISDFSRMSVMRLSGVMCTQALKGLAVFFSCSCAGSSAVLAGMWKPMTRPALAAALVFRNARRSRFRTGVRVAMVHLKNGLQRRRREKTLENLAERLLLDGCMLVRADMSAQPGVAALLRGGGFGVAGIDFGGAVDGFANALIGAA